MKYVMVSCFIFSFCFLAGCKDIDDANLKQHPVHLIYDFNPKKGNSGTVVTITGSYFSTTAEDNKIKFAGIEAEVINATSSELKVKAPKNVMTGPISLTINGLTSQTRDSFVVE